MGGTMVLSEAERWCAANLLRYVPIRDLEAISQTVTKGMVTPTSAEECVRIIIFHSDSPKSLLSRKKVTREVLFKYLYDNQVLVTASMEKSALIEHVLSLWNYTATSYKLGESDHRSRQLDHVSQRALCTRNEVEQQTEQLTVPQQSNQCFSHSVERKASPVVAVAPGLSIEEVNELSVKFCEWFYRLLNCAQGDGERLSPEHFWTDCGIYLLMNSPSGSQEVMKKGAECVVDLLLSTKHQHNLFFNPNLSMSGVKGKLDPHGLVMVFACGTLHQSQNCVGVFEQMFLLARDPFSSNNWKVKSTKLRLRSSSVESLPALQDENISQLIALPES